MANPTNPFIDLSRVFERMQGDFEEIARSWSEEPELVSSPVRVDLKETDDEFVLTAELPGFDKDDIDVRVTDSTLRLEAQHAEETEAEEEGEYIRRERHRASVTRSISLPEAVEADDISATFNNGVLTVQMLKSEPVTQGKQIEIS
ncbi:MAG: Hsp20/alpha crystallin family protein [Halodesulfurarchaeum sp.]